MRTRGTGCPGRQRALVEPASQTSSSTAWFECSCVKATPPNVNRIDEKVTMGTFDWKDEGQEVRKRVGQWSYVRDVV